MVPNLILNNIITWGQIAMSKETSHKSCLIGRKSPLTLYQKIGFFEVYKRCRAPLSTQCILILLIVLLLSFNLRCSYIAQNVATLTLPAPSRPLYLMLLPLFCLEMSLAESRGSSLASGPICTVLTKIVCLKVSLFLTVRLEKVHSFRSSLG